MKKIESFLRDNEYVKFKEYIYEFSEKLGGGYGAGSFLNSYYLTESPEKDIVDLYKFLLKKGINLYEYMKKYKKYILKDSYFTETDGFYDYLLYHFYGFDLSGIRLEDQGGYSRVMRYQYGFQNVYLGKKFIEQSYEDIDDFYYLLCSDLPEFIEEEGIKLPKKLNLEKERHEGFSAVKFYIGKLSYSDNWDLENEILKNIDHVITSDNYLICLFGDKDVIKNLDKDEGGIVQDYFLSIVSSKFGL